MDAEEHKPIIQYADVEEPQVITVSINCSTVDYNIWTLVLTNPPEEESHQHVQEQSFETTEIRLPQEIKFEPTEIKYEPTEIKFEPLEFEEIIEDQSEQLDETAKSFCFTCNKAFKTPQAKSNHRKRHHTRGIHLCKCGQEFAFYHQLKKHKETCGICPFCKHNFVYPSKLRRHLETCSFK